VSVAFTWDIDWAEQLAEAWSHVAPVQIGGPRDTLEQAEVRLRLCVELGFFPMAMLWRDQNGITDPQWRAFQREWARPSIIYRKCTAESCGRFTSSVQQAQTAIGN